ncbi:hypothetical protein ACRC6Q_16710 [Planococcus sp. SE5232]|uniref:hypothetical protein n=1 Tax=unclassified Planococcus (in: firmicutes) TaxID=2662419 RepID=UPI003D6ACFF4
MGILEVLTIIFIVLKITGTIDWSWWVVLSPTIISVSLYIIWFIVLLVINRKARNHIDKHFDNDFFKD